MSVAAKCCIAGMVKLSVAIHDHHCVLNENCRLSHGLKIVALSNCTTSDIAMVNAPEVSVICTIDEDVVTHTVIGTV